MGRWIKRKQLGSQHTILLIFFVGAFAILGVSQLLSSRAADVGSRADINRDGAVNQADVAALLAKFGSNDAPSDLNNDGSVGIIDLSLLLSSLVQGPSPPPTNTGVQAARAADFIDTVGINTHPNYFDTSYGNWDMVKQRLAELNIKHTRGSSYWNFAEADRRQDQLHAMGIKVNMILSPDNFAEQVAYLKTKPRGFVTGVESLNEPDCFLIKKNPGGWVEETRRLQQSAYQTMKADPALKDIPVLSTSYCRGETHAKVGDLSQWYDYINTHPYPGGGAPEDRITQSMENIRTAYGNKPVSATETGYHNAVEFLEGGGVSEQASAVYIPRLYLTYFQAGIKRAYLYELVEPRPGTWVTATFDRDNHMGLYRSNFAPKPAADSVRRMMTILKDESTNFAPGKLDYAITGDSSNLQQQLLQKADGTFYLALWRKDTIWNVGARSAVAAPAKPLTVTFKPGARQVNIYNVNQADGPVSTGSGSAYNLNLGPELQILQITP